MAKRVYFTINRTKTLYENLIEMVKIFAPVELSIARMTKEKTSNTLKISGVSIYGVDKYKIDTLDISNVTKIAVSAYLNDGIYKRHRRIYRSWTTPIINDRICITALERNFKGLSSLKSQVEKRNKIREEERKAYSDKLKELITFNNLDIPNRSILITGSNNKYNLEIHNISEEEINLLSSSINHVLRKIE